MSDLFDMIWARSGSGSGGGADSAALSEVVDAGAKNLLLLDAETETRTNLTFTRNSDDTITVTGTANSGNTDYTLTDNVRLKPGKYVLSGCPAGGNNSNTYKMQLYGIGYDTGNGLEFTLTTEKKINLYIRIWGNYTPNNLVFKPMICTKAAWDASHEFKPYAPTNRELYEMIRSMQG